MQFRLGFWGTAVALLWGLLLPAFSIFAEEEYVVGETYKVLIEDLKPTQYSVSRKEVAIRLKTIKEKDDDDKLVKHKKKKAGSAVVAPNGQLYIVDGHHFATALAEYGHNKVYVDILANFSDSGLTMAEFWEKMIKKKWVYLKDNHGGDIRPANLPRSLKGLKDDPYRGLAWMVRKLHGFDELDIPFQEFMWGDFLRSRVSIKTNASNAAWEKAVHEALKWAASKEARHLPGWHGREVTCGDILSSIGDD